VFAVKTMRAIPYISAPFRGGSKWMRPFYQIRKFFINIPIKDTGDRIIELAPWPTDISAEAVGDKRVGNVMHFAEEDLNNPEGEMLKKHISEKGPVIPDVVILATGYRQVVEFLDDSYPGINDVKHRFVYDDIEDGFAYIGFVRPSIGKFIRSGPAPTSNLAHNFKSLHSPQ
jgi:dimethylaniline monooxygenase (N-oxide forming)